MPITYLKKQNITGDLKAPSYPTLIASSPPVLPVQPLSYILY